MNEKTETESGPVAVIAVHGVADQRKDETAVKAVNLLLHLDGLEPREGDDFNAEGYEGFQEEKIHVGVKPFDVSSIGDEDAWHYQLREHLKNYESDERKEVYETLRMEGERTTRSSPDAEPKIDRKVHIYEMHWADVSNLKLGILNLFVAIYRLLFEASWLGKQSIGKWASFGPDVGKMSSLTSLRGIMILFHSITTMVLTRFMPVMYLLMMLMLMLTAIPVLESKWAEGIFNGIGGYSGLFTFSIVLMVGAALVGVAFKFWRRIPWPPVYLIIALVCFLVANVALALLQGNEGSWWAESGLALMAWLGVCLLVNAFVLPMLNRVFPGTRLVGNFLLIFFTIGLLFGLAHDCEWPMLISGPIQALRFASALLPLAWIVLSTSANIFLVLAMLELFSLWFRRGLSKEVIQRRRSRLRTGVLSITIPVLLISFLNATFFQLVLIPAKMGGLDGVHTVASRSSDCPSEIHSIETGLHQHVEPWVSRFSSFPDFEAWSDENSGPSAMFSDYAKYASTEMVIPFLEVIFLIIVLVLGYSLWIVTPAVLAERRRAVNQGGKKWEKLSVALGKNLTQGYKWIWLGQVILVGCLLVTQILFTYRGIRAQELQSGGGDDSPVTVLVDQFLGLRNSEMKGIASIAETSVTKDREQLDRIERWMKSHPNSRYKGDTAYKREKIRKYIREIWQGDTNNSNKPVVPPVPVPVPNRDPLESIHNQEDGPPEIVINLLTETIAFFNNGPLTSALGISILLLGLGYVFFSRLADPLVSGLRGGLDVALDVVSYLHPFPKNRTTRAQILSRYASLMRYILEWRDPRNPETGYSRIVILTHSQGGVITSDLLRALSAGTVAHDNGLEGLSSTSPQGHIPVRFLSMGSPLLQLYNARFPDLYAWDPKADPRATHLGLECWWNLYRSGDYVGRMIFRDIKDKDIFVPEKDYVMTHDGKAVPVRETCIGPGAHTQYWDKSAPPSVVRKFDCLISCDDVTDLARDEDSEEEVESGDGNG